MDKSAGSRKLQILSTRTGMEPYYRTARTFPDSGRSCEMEDSPIAGSAEGGEAVATKLGDKGTQTA